MPSPRAVLLAGLCLVVLAAAPAAAQATAGPVAAYGFEDAGPATAGDSSAFGNAGSVQGAVRVPGRYGSGMSFDGTNDSVIVPDAGSLNLASGMTLEAWVKPTATDGWRTVAIKQRLSNISYGLYGSSSVVSTDGEDGSAAFSSPDANSWTHVASTYDGNTLRVYVNGVQAGTSTARSGPITPGNGPLSIGGNSIWGEWFKGVIDEVRVYDRSLSAAEIQSDMTAPVGNPASPSGPGPDQVGSWTAPESWPMVAVHTSMLSNGKVVAWDAFSAAPQSEHVWNPETGLFEPAPSGINLFCSGHVLLPDGRLFVAGGHELAYAGLKNTMLYSSNLGSWTAGPDMARGRWYPTTTTLPDGRVLIVSGDGIRPGPNDPFFVRPSQTIPEIYDPKSNTMTAMPSAGRLMPLYPFMFVAPDGRVVDVGPDTTTRMLDTATGQWATLASRSPITGGSAVMYRPGKVLKTGTWTDTDYGRPVIQNRSAVLDLDQTVPAWRDVASMKWARTYHTLTVLPDGDVLAMGGQSMAGANSLYNSPVLQPEIWHPETDTWTPMASSVRPRGYHNTSLLLPDGRILLAGSGRLDGSLMVNETSAEIYSPPYLSKGPRPTISYAPGTMQYGGTINVDTPDVARIAKVSLVRTGAVTHNINMDQRWQQLTFRKVGGHLEIDAPASANDAPPGVYYVFLIDDKGVPSKAAMLSMSTVATGDTSAPSVSVTGPAAGATVRGAVSVTATASDDVGVAGVQFQLDGAALGGEDTSAPYAINWDTATATAGPHTLTAVARDAAGNRTTATPVTVTVDNSAPTGPVPVAAYAFENGTGTTLTDVTGKGHTGTIREATWTTAGKYGKALNFDGINDWVTIEDAADLHLTNAMTLEAWVYPTKNTTWRTAILKEQTGDLAWALYSSGSAKPSAWTATSTGIGSATGPTAPALNTWTHLAATYDASTLRLYVNGTQAATTTRTGPLTTSTGALRLGGNNLWNEWFAGRLDDIRIYNQPLTPTQIQTDMTTPAG
jgi:hypothetical protein